MTAAPPDAGRNRPASSADLAREGWRRRCVADEPRLGEAVELYRELGLEVLLLPAQDEAAAAPEAGSCRACFGTGAAAASYQVVYTRPQGAGAKAGGG